VMSRWMCGVSLMRGDGCVVPGVGIGAGVNQISLIDHLFGPILFSVLILIPENHTGTKNHNLCCIESDLQSNVTKFFLNYTVTFLELLVELPDLHGGQIFGVTFGKFFRGSIPISLC
jgi:hypothetical protein